MEEAKRQVDTIEVEGVKVWLHNFLSDKGTEYARARARLHHSYDTCPFCRKRIVKGDVILIITKGMSIFPNKSVHTECFNNFKSPQEAIIHLKKDWEEANKRRCWFE